MIWRDVRYSVNRQAGGGRRSRRTGAPFDSPGGLPYTPLQISAVRILHLAASIGFGLAIIFFSFLADRFGYGRLMLIAFLLPDGENIDQLARSYHVPREAIEAARAYYSVNKAIIDDRIEANRNA